MNVTLLVDFVLDLTRVVSRRLEMLIQTRCFRLKVMVSIAFLILVDRFNVVLFLRAIEPRVVLAELNLILVLLVVATVGLSVADAVLGRLGLPAAVAVGLPLSVLLLVHVTELAAVEGLMMLLMHGLFDDEVDLLLVVIVVRLGLLFDLVAVAFGMVRLLVNCDGVVDGLLVATMEVKLVILVIERWLVSLFPLRTLLVAIRVGVGVVEGVVDGVLVIVDGLDIVLVVVGVVQSVVSLVVRMVLLTVAVMEIF